MTDRILPAPDMYASCPYDGEVLRYYAGVFSSVYIALSPFVQPDATFYERYLWEAGVSRKEALAHCKPVPWKEIANRCGLPDVAAVDIALRTRIHALRSEFGNITISSSGFQKGAALISAGKTVTWKIPRGPTADFAIAFDLGEKRFSYPQDVYFESEDWEVTVTVDATGWASADSNLASLFTQIVGRW